LTILTLLALAVSLTIITWVGIDAARRRRNWFAWSSGASFFGIFGLLAWLIARRRNETSPEQIGFRRGLQIALTAPLLLGLTAVFLIWLNTFVFQVARVEGQAMSPTLLDQDRLIVNKTVYHTRDPQAGEIVMMYYPLNPDRSFVKRVIAEQGDQVRIVGGRVIRNDVPMDESFIPPEFRSHETWGPAVVPEGYYFVLGDRRNNSSDSRHWGFVPRKYIVGRVQYRWWPMSRATAF
jgi:signal peptidase I